MNRSLLSRVALGLLGLSFGPLLACQMSNPAYDQADAGETRASGDPDLDTTSAEGNTSIGDGDGDTTPGDGDGDTTPGDGDGDTTPGDGDGDTNTGDGDGDTNTGDGDGDGDTNTGDGDGDTNTGDGDGDAEPLCGDGVLDDGEECDDGNANDGDGCESDCTVSNGGDGDGDGGMIMCAFTLDPVTCPECLGNFCCFMDAQMCAQNPKCLLMLPCLAANGDPAFCAEEVEADQNLIPLAMATVGCAEMHCPEQCIQG
jgi:cysteine-rich repeat protein